MMRRLIDAGELGEALELFLDSGSTRSKGPFRHHVRRHGVEYLAGQTYLDPDPKELMLRNHV